MGWKLLQTLFIGKGMKSNFRKENKRNQIRTTLKGFRKTTYERKIWEYFEKHGKDYPFRWLA